MRLLYALFRYFSLTPKERDIRYNQKIKYSLKTRANTPSSH